MRSVEEQMNEIRSRKRGYENKKKVRKLALSGAGLLVALIAVIAIAPYSIGSMEQNTTTVLGSTILGAEIGGYVLVALIAFVLGIVVATAVSKYNSKDNLSEGSNREKKV